MFIEWTSERSPLLILSIFPITTDNTCSYFDRPLFFHFLSTFPLYSTGEPYELGSAECMKLDDSMWTNQVCSRCSLFLFSNGRFLHFTGGRGQVRHKTDENWASFVQPLSGFCTQHKTKFSCAPLIRGKLRILSAVFHWTVLMAVVRGVWQAAMPALAEVTTWGVMERCLSQPGQGELPEITGQSRNVAHLSTGIGLDLSSAVKANKVLKNRSMEVSPWNLWQSAGWQPVCLNIVAPQILRSKS